MRKPVSIMHTADVHLDNNIGEPGAESHAQSGFMEVIDRAIELDVDLFLLAGDLFDHNRVAEQCLEFASLQLARLHCPVVMITGNHDCLADYSVYHRYAPEAVEHVNFIRDIDGDSLDFPSLGLRVWGRGLVDHHPDVRPVGEVPHHHGEEWYVGVAHGYYVESGGEMRSSRISPAEVEASGLDYLALGHVHVFSTFRHGRTVAAYPGTPNRSQGTDRATAAHVMLDPEAGVIVNPVVLEYPR